MSNVYAVILAAGKGTRMYSDKPKALQTLLGEAMISYVYAAAKEHCQGIYTVVGHLAEQVMAYYKGVYFNEDAVQNCLIQKEQLGTGHALLTAFHGMEQKISFSPQDKILIINADTPLLTSEIIADFIKKSQNTPLTFLSLNLEEPGAYGRVMREQFIESAKKCNCLSPEQNCGNVLEIVEAKDFKANYPNLEIYEVNSGIYLINLEILTKYLPKLSTQNAGQEYYLTDIVSLAKNDGYAVEAFCSENAHALLGVNNAHELHLAEKYLLERENNRRMKEGVILHYPESIKISPLAKIAKGVEIFGPCEIYGACTIEQNSCLESHTIIKNSSIGANCQIKSFSHLEEAILKDNVTIGPYARLRPGSELEQDCRIGNFVEIKKSLIGQGSKVNHLSYIGDAVLGSKVNVGAGSITCNYDGEKKHQTIIEDNAFLGSNTSYVAPVKVGKDSLIGAGSVITKDVPDMHLAVSRAEQKIIKRLNKS